MPSDTSNGTAARLCTRHRQPNTEPNPVARYGPTTPDQLADKLNQQADYACKQWQAGRGVVGPVGSEQNLPYRLFNNPQSAGFDANQAFAYQHDLQATDAAAQVQRNLGPDASKLDHVAAAAREHAYTAANMDSATEGMFVLKTTGDVRQALTRTQEVFRQYGFEVRQSY